MPNAHRVVLVATLLSSALLRLASADDVETLREENRRLRARVEALEAENAKLRADNRSPLAAAIEAHAAEEVHVEGEGTAAVVTTEPSRLDTSSGPHSRHWIWLRARSAAPDPVDLVIDAAVSGTAYRGVDALELDVDGTRERLTVVRRSTESRTPTRGSPGTGAAGETVTVALPQIGRASCREREETYVVSVS